MEAVHAIGGACLVTADHGNCDHMLNDDGSPNTAHSLNPVPFIVTNGADALDGEGILADVAPTALQLLGIEQPEAMTGRSLIGIGCPRNYRPLKCRTMAMPDTSVNFSAPELSAWRGMLRVHTALVKALDAELAAAHDLPLSSYEVLITLSAPGAQAPDGGAGGFGAALALRDDAARRPAREGPAARARHLHRRRSRVLRGAHREGRGAAGNARPTHLEGVRERFLRHFSEDEMRLLAGMWERVFPGSAGVRRVELPVMAEGRERILDTAYELFSKHGTRAVGVDRIIAEAGAAKMTLYRNFASKDELIVAFLARPRGALDARLAAARGRAPRRPRPRRACWRSSTSSATGSRCPTSRAARSST